LTCQIHVGYAYGHKSLEADDALCERGRGEEPAVGLSGSGQKDKEPIVVTHYGKPYALIQPLSERDLESLGWRQLGEARLREAWEEEDDALYDYL